MNQDTPLSKSAQVVQGALRSKGFSYNVQELTATTRTAQDAASALRCEVAQIVKSLLFRTATQEPILVLMSGSNRVDEKKLTKLVGMDVLKADADFTRKLQVLRLAASLR
jgi:prolyl-tRNA editing enzyme YbaK/EbsC (Cys-tRNA(Pro) deacylase)